MKYCPSCGTENEDSASFCVNCGKQFTATSEAPPAFAGTSAPPAPQPPPYPPSGLVDGYPPGFGYHQQADPSKPPVFAGFWIRFLAIFIDNCIIGAVFMPFRFVTNFSISNNHPADATQVAVVAFFALLQMACFFAYFILMTGYKGQTLGKMALRLKVVKQDLSPVDYGVAAGREFSKIISVVTCYIGFIIAGFDSEKRALHDMIAKTYVIKY
ncbi:MAG: hypothetical protein CVT63_03435 [Candidatus Anoxymicrobium japonicum]|uniref:RDD domain-containing protein n=1 Tax=Candidatus Anoxymicrobium japonicum TaxID=2013648 RepID=A0A2N3G6E3_9ACTN|nr:MAG: hypothetical protein CVT63_03435 [Candidatus Anoxymicrobium japonicum]